MYIMEMCEGEKEVRDDWTEIESLKVQYPLKWKASRNYSTHRWRATVICISTITTLVAADPHELMITARTWLLVFLVVRAIFTYQNYIISFEELITRLVKHNAILSCGWRSIRRL